MVEFMAFLNIKVKKLWTEQPIEECFKSPKSLHSGAKTEVENKMVWREKDYIKCF